MGLFFDFWYNPRFFPNGILQIMRFGRDAPFKNFWHIYRIGHFYLYFFGGDEDFAASILLFGFPIGIHDFFH
jgi:hypothetical protein